MPSISRKLSKIIDTFLKRGSQCDRGYEKIPICESDNRFPSFQQGFNRRWSAPKLEAVYLCFSAQGTQEALDDAIGEYGGNVKIKGGGHCYENFVYSDRTRAIIDVTPMKGAGLDDDRGYFLEAGGTNWSAFEALFRDYGKVLPAGSCYSVGLGGHICGGGYGLLSRLHGLTVDWLTGVEIVVKDNGNARTLYVSKDSITQDEYDLYWAQCGGGGGNFGIITKYYFADLPPAPKSAVISTIAFGWDCLNSPEILGSLFNCFTDLALEESGQLFGLFKLQHETTGEIQLVLQIALPDGMPLVKAAAEELVAPIHEKFKEIRQYRRVTRPVIGHTGWFTVGADQTYPANLYSFYEAVQTLNGSGPNQRGKYKSAYMRKPFPPNQVEAIFNGLKYIPPNLKPEDMMQSLLQVDTYGGAINKIDPKATPIAQRSSILKLQYQTYWQNPENDDFHLEWIRKMYSEVYADMDGVPDPEKDDEDNVDGCYYNYPDIDLNDNLDLDGVLKLYFLDNYEKNPRNLVKVKRRWDPNNYFNSLQSIPVK